MYDTCYFYEDRIPSKLRDVCKGKLIEHNLSFKECSYSLPLEQINNILKECNTILFAPGRFLPESIFCDNKHLKLMQIWSSGYDKFNLKDAKANNIKVANNGGANAISVAEHTVMMILAAFLTHQEYQKLKKIKIRVFTLVTQN